VATIDSFDCTAFSTTAAKLVSVATTSATAASVELIWTDDC
jgi:hypothetical protein